MNLKKLFLRVETSILPGILILLLTMPLVWTTQGCKGTDKTDEGLLPQVQATLYYMSRCPYGKQALTGLQQAQAHLSGSIQLDLNLEYVGLEGKDGTLRSLNGAGEVMGNQAQLCAGEQGKEALNRFLACQMEDLSKIPGNTIPCVTGSHLDQELFSRCYDEEKGKNLLRDSFQRTANRGITAGPVITIGDQVYQGEHTPRELIKSICAEFPKESLPTECKDNLQEDTSGAGATKVIIITDRRCRTCDPQAIMKSAGLGQLNLKEEILDYGQSPEARRLMEKTGHKLLPVILFEQGVENNAPVFQKIGRQLESHGDFRSLRIKAQFNPAAEICDNGIDDTGNGLVDCMDPTCFDTLPCRPESPGQVDLFLTGDQSGKGTRFALDALLSLIDRFDDQLHYTVRLLAPYKTSELAGLDKNKELAIPLFNTCAILNQPVTKDKVVSYLQCHHQSDLKKDAGEKCAAQTGLDLSFINRCVEGEDGMRILATQNLMAEKLELENTPAWLINNRHLTGALNPNGLQTEICKYNKDLAGCDTPLQKEAGHVHGPDCNH